MKNLSLLILSVVIFFGCGSEEVQSQMMMDFFPATGNTLAGVNVYSTKTAEFKQYYVQDGKWNLNEGIPSVNTMIKGGDYRMQYLPGGKGGSPNLLVYSAKSGQFQFYYLDNEGWKINTLLPGGNLNLGSKGARMEFTPGGNGSTAYLFAHSTDGKNLKVMEVKDGEWVAIEYFPGKI